MNSTLLPPNTTSLERAAAEALAEFERMPVPLRTLWNPNRCPLELLPYLAWAFSVDRWDPAWDEPTKRQVIRDSFYVHKHKGTIAALCRVVEPVGYLLDVDEWWQQSPPGPPGTFALRIGTLDQGIEEATYFEIERLIDNARPISRHVAALDLFGETLGPIYLGAAIHDGDLTTVYPRSP